MMNKKHDRPWRQRIGTILPIVAAVTLGSVATVLASHQFNDVGDAHAFHDEISAIADAGITTGFPDGGFHPAADVTRQAMAAFMERGLTSASSDFGVGVLGTESGVFESEAATVEVEAGATGGGGGFVVLNATWTAYALGEESNVETQCPCEIQGLISDAMSPLRATWEDLGGTVTDTGFSNASGATSLVVPIAADTAATYTLSIGIADAEVDSVVFEGSLTALYVPFGSVPMEMMSSDPGGVRQR